MAERKDRGTINARTDKHRQLLEERFDVVHTMVLRGTQNIHAFTLYQKKIAEGGNFGQQPEPIVFNDNTCIGVDDPITGEEVRYTRTDLENLYS